MGPDYIGPAVDHFQEITYQYPEVRKQAVQRVVFMSAVAEFSIFAVICACANAPLEIRGRSSAYVHHNRNSGPKASRHRKVE